MAGNEEQESGVQPSSIGTVDRRADVDQRLDGLRPELQALLRSIGAQPELGFQEHHAVGEIVRLLEAHGQSVEVGLAGMETAFRARTGPGGGNGSGAGAGNGPRVAVLAEYDALPGLGHACGHNVIATVAVGAYLTLAELLPRGSVELIGCPAEESAVDGAGGKVRLLADGVFHGVDAALMVHPYDRNMVVTHGSLAARGVDLEFRGRATHAVANPENGLNALDAAVSAYVAITRLRDQLPREHYMNAIIPEGGASANIVPDYTRVRYRLRAPTVPEVDVLLECVVDAARAVALAAGCEFEAREYAPLYAEIRQDPELVEIARRVMVEGGLTLERDVESISISSTDFGNVSQVIRALEVGVQLAPRGTGLHTPAFEQAANGPGAVDIALRGAQVLALTALEGLFDA